MEEPFKKILEPIGKPNASYLLERVRYYRKAERAVKRNLRVYVDYGLHAIVAVDASEWDAYQQALCEEGLR